MTWTQPQKPWRRTKTWRPYPAETPPLRGSGADAFTASSSSMVYGVGLLGPAFPAFGPQVEWPDTNIGPTCPTPLVPKICPNPLVPKILPVVAILALRAFVGRITVYPASQCLKCLLWAPSSLSTRSRATGQIREKKEEKTAINGSNLSERKRKFVFSTRTSWDWLTIGDCINIAHYIGFWQMHCRKRIPSLTMMTRFNFSLPKEPYYNTFTSVWWCVMQSQRSHQQLPAANIPFLLRRLPCEEVELMLQRHRRRPWCMWSGCQRPHFLLSGLKWTGQTQILAQHAPPR